MFLVFNKEKISAYIISVFTVFILFFIANTTMQETVETSTNSTYNDIIITNNISVNNTINVMKY